MHLISSWTPVFDCGFLEDCAFSKIVILFKESVMLLNVFLFCIYPNAQNWSVLWSKSGPFFCKRFCLCLCSLPKSTQQNRPFLLLAPISLSLPLGHCCYCFVPPSLLFLPIYRSAWTDCEFPVACSFSDEWSTIVVVWSLLVSSLFIQTFSWGFC